MVRPYLIAFLFTIIKMPPPLFPGLLLWHHSTPGCQIPATMFRPMFTVFRRSLPPAFLTIYNIRVYSCLLNITISLSS